MGHQLIITVIAGFVKGWKWLFWWKRLQTPVNLREFVSKHLFTTFSVGTCAGLSHLWASRVVSEQALGSVDVCSAHIPVSEKRKDSAPGKSCCFTLQRAGGKPRLIWCMLHLYDETITSQYITAVMCYCKHKVSCTELSEVKPYFLFYSFFFFHLM